MRPGEPPRYEVAVIGAGQAGLAMGHYLARQGRRFVILERADAIGAAWRERWDSLVLFTPRRYDALPGLPFPGEPNGYPTRDEVVAYLEQYATAFDLPIELSSAVRSLKKRDGAFVLDLDDRSVEADQVVVATGPFQVPRKPDFAARLAPEIVQRDSTGYRSPAELPGGRVLVVGGGNTGFQIAEELADSREVHLSIGSRQPALPQRILGRDLFRWLEGAGLMRKSTSSRIGRRMRQRDPVLIGSSPRSIARRGVRLRPRTVAASGRTIGFEDGSELEVDAVIWATGHRPDHSWIRVPATDKEGRLRHRRGVTDIPGLYVLGLSWQHTRGSALLGWVKEDAEYIAGRVRDFLADAASASSEDAGEGMRMARRAPSR